MDVSMGGKGDFILILVSCSTERKLGGYDCFSDSQL